MFTREEDKFRVARLRYGTGDCVTVYGFPAEHYGIPTVAVAAQPDLLHRMLPEQGERLARALTLAAAVARGELAVVNDHTFPELRRAFAAIEEDNGGHLIGTVYPGERIDLHRFTVPKAWVRLCAPAEAALKRLRESSEADWETFVIGEQSEAEALERRQGDLAAARNLLNDFFNGWQPAD